MNRLAPRNHAFSRSHMRSCIAYGVQYVVGHRGRIFFEIAYRLRRRRAVPIGSDAVIEALFNGR